MPGIYKGYNPIYESLRREVFEAESKVDLGVLARTAYDTFVNVVMNSTDEATKTPDGFKAFMDKVLQSSSLDGIKGELTKKLDLLAAADKNQVESINSSKSYLVQLFEELSKLVGSDSAGTKEVLDMMSGFVGSTVSGLQGVQAQLAQNESLVTRYLAEADEEMTGEESSSEEGIADKWYTQLSKNLLDSATSFAGETSAAMSNKTLSGDSGIAGFSDAAQKYLEQAKDLAITGGRRGILKLGKLETASGKMKGKDYRVKAQNLINEIIRQREEFQKLKYRLSNVPAPQDPIVVCPPGMVFDKAKNACVYKSIPAPVKQEETGGTGGGGTVTPPKPNVSCSFPLKVGSKKCDQVVSIQNKLASMDPCIADILNKSGGADGKYGKVTAKLANITHAYLKGASTFDPSGDLTQQMYDDIMRGSAIPQTYQGSEVKKESLDVSKVLESKIFEREYQVGPVLSFEDFTEVVSEANYEIDEQDAAAYKAPPAIGSCICKTYSDGIMDPACKSAIIPAPVPGTTGATGATGATGPLPPSREDWKGLKYVDTGSYPISFDESLLSAWSKEIALTAVSFAIPGSGYLLKAGSAGARSLGSKAAMKVGANKLANKIAGKAAVARAAATISGRKTASSQLAGLTRMFWVKYKKIPIPKRVAGGLIGGTLGAGVLDFISGRNSYVVTVAEGYIERTNLLGMVKGMVDTIDGYVSDDDWATITTVLAVIKGAWTTDESDNPVSAWGELKRLYQEAEGEDLVSDIESISAKTGDVEGYPKIKSLSPLSGTQDLDWDIALSETKKFVSVLDKNESALSQNLKSLPKDYVQAFIEGNFAEYNEDGEIEGVESEYNQEEGSKSEGTEKKGL